MWGSVVIVACTQQFIPWGPKIASNLFPFYAAYAIAPVVLIEYGYRRWSPGVNIRCEAVLLTAAWGLIALGVWGTGGASSPYYLMACFPALFAGYFVRSPRFLGFQAFMLLLSMSAPFAYDIDDALTNGYAPTVFVATAIYAVVAGIVFMRRREARASNLEARRLALADPLTGVANLRAFEEFTGLVTEEYDGYAVLMIDLDGLKAANTVFGHAGGDDMIVRSSRLLLAVSRPQDQVARVGGDEFVVMMPEGTEHGVSMWQARFQVAVRSHNEMVRGRRPQISASSGGAVFGSDGSSVGELMAAADKRMYAHKAATTTIHKRLDAVETAGGHKLSYEDHRVRKIKWDRFVASFEWFVAGALMVIASQLPGFNPAWRDGTVLIVSASIGMSIWSAMGELWFQRIGRQVSDLVAIGSIAPGLLLTGGAASPALALVMMICSYFSDFRERRAAVIRVSGALVALTIGYWAGGTDFGSGQMTYTLMTSAIIVIAVTLQHNGRLTHASAIRIRELSEIDALTGVANRRVFESQMADAVTKIELGFKSDGPVLRGRPAVILIDFDDFKDVNTRLGHGGGDALLVALAQTLRDATGDDGQVCRIGGDEFAIVVATESSEWVGALAERVRVAAHELNSALADELGDLHVSVSAGYATWRETHTVASLIAEADAALQNSKDHGKDQVSVVRPVSAIARG